MPDPSARPTAHELAALIGGASRRAEADGFGEVAGSPGPSTPYYCPRCEVWGSGSQCWCCARTVLIRRGPLVDVVVYDPTT